MSYLNNWMISLSSVISTFEEHMVWLEKVLEKISTAGLTINFDKCVLSLTSTLFRICSQEGLTVDPDKTDIKYPALRNIKQLRRFLGMSSWYRFILQFITLSEPHGFWRKTSAGSGGMSRFASLSKKLITAPTLACSNFEKPFILQTDASLVGLDTVLTQVIEGEERVTAFASWALSDPEKKYSVTEQECLAVVWAIQKFRSYLEGYRFTDYRSW